MGCTESKMAKGTKPGSRATYKGASYVCTNKPHTTGDRNNIRAGALRSVRGNRTAALVGTKAYTPPHSRGSCSEPRGDSSTPNPSFSELTLPATAVAESRSCSPEAAPEQRVPVPPAPVTATEENTTGGAERLREALSRQETYGRPRSGVKQHITSAGTAGAHPRPREAFSRQKGYGAQSNGQEMKHDRPASIRPEVAEDNVFAPWLRGTGELLRPPPSECIMPSARPAAVFKDSEKMLQAATTLPVAIRCRECTEDVENELGALTAEMFHQRRSGRDPCVIRAEAERMRRRSKELSDGLLDLMRCNDALRENIPAPSKVEEDCVYSTDEPEWETAQYQLRCARADADRQRRKDGATTNLAFVFALTKKRRDARLAAQKPGATQRPFRQQHQAAPSRSAMPKLRVYPAGGGAPFTLHGTCDSREEIRRRSQAAPTSRGTARPASSRLHRARDGKVHA